MANVLGDEKKQQVLALGRLGWSLRRIQGATGVRRETASLYLRQAGVAVRGHGGGAPKPATSIEVSTDSAPGISVDPDSKPATQEEVSTDFAAPPGAEPTRSPTASACEPHRDFIEQSLRRGRNAVAIWQDLVDDHGFTSRYSSVRRFVARLEGGQTPEAHPRIATAPGEEAQVDYGEGPMVRQDSGKYRRTRLFVLTLGFSRKSVRLLAWRSSSRAWAELHERAFRRLGGVPRLVVLDNLREGVLKPDVYDAALNPLYRDMLAHYGVVALPCRVRDPDRKGKVESAVGHAQKTPLRGLRFETLDDAQAYLDRWEERWADTRIHGTTKQQVASMFAEEQPLLGQLPIEPFRYYEYGERTVNLDGYAEVDGAYYAPPPGWIGRKVSVQWDGVLVRLLNPATSKLLREHRRSDRGRYRIRDEDRPARTPQTTLTLLSRAAAAGQHVGALANAIHAQDGEIGVRKILGLLSLAKRLGARSVDDACAAALEMGVPTYRFVKRYLARHPPTPLSLRQVDPLIRELTHYRDLIDRKTGDPA